MQNGFESRFTQRPLSVCSPAARARLSRRSSPSHRAGSASADDPWVASVGRGGGRRIVVVPQPAAGSRTDADSSKLKAHGAFAGWKSSPRAQQRR